MYLEEIVIDKSNPTSFMVSYRLPYEANVNAEEYYPRAEYITPFKNNFRFYITGLREELSQNGEISFVLSYPTICLEAAPLSAVWDYWSFYPDGIDRFRGSSVTIIVDGVFQPAAQITDYYTLIKTGSKPSHYLQVRGKWNYCLNADWRVGLHTIQIIVSPPKHATESYTLKFEARAVLFDAPKFLTK